MDIFGYEGDLKRYLEEYDYGGPLTQKLDSLGNDDLNLMRLYEIILWKVNRFVDFDHGTIANINELKHLQPGEHRKAESVLDELLAMNGIDLPMASTILRFRNPQVFPIIDRRAYRAIYNTKYPLYFTTPRPKKIAKYFEYTDRLVEICHARNLEFSTVDRLLYQFDVVNNGKL